MPLIKYISHAGVETEINAASGTTVMQAAVDNGVDGIVGECGGSAMCATCHVYVDEADAGKFSPADATEQEMLSCAVSPLQPGSRLGCQLILRDDCGTVVVRLPEHQQ